MTTSNLKQSTWRERQITLNPGLNEITFPDTLPNYIQINNLGAGEIYFGATIIPSASIYDKSVTPYGEVLYARDTGLSRCQIFNGSQNPNRITLTTFEDTFNPATMVSQSVSVAGGGGSGGSGGVITGFSVPLPAGNNNIGKVVVTDMPAVSLDLPTLPPGTNSIGKVHVETLPPLAAGTSHIGTVNVANGITITDMPPVNLSGGVTITNAEFTMKPNTGYYHYNGAVSTTEIAITLTSPVTEFPYIQNDDTVNSLLVSFGETPTTDSQTGENAVIVLLPGEGLHDFRFRTSKINLRRPTGSGTVRIMGVR